jgi:predicted Zn-dependent peptidase
MSLNRSTPPAIKQATDFTIQLPSCETVSLSETNKLYMVNAGTQDVISFEIYIPKLLESQKEVVVSKAVASLLKSGTGSLSALQISERIEQVGASISISQNNDFFIVKLTCLSRHFINLLPLLFELIQDPTFPKDELEIYRQQAIQNMSVNLKKSEFIANRTIDELMYGFDHPYGSYSLMKDYHSLSQNDLISFHKKYISLEKATFFLSGKFEQGVIKEIQSEFEKRKVSSSAILKPIATIKPTESKKHRITNDEKALQGALRIAKKFVSRTHEDFIPMLFTNTLFGGYFGSRLMSNIREDKGYTYGIYSFVQQNMEANTYVIATDVGKDVAEKAVEEVWHEMKRLRTEPVPSEELQLVKNYILGSILGSIDGPFKIMSRWKSLILNNSDEKKFQKSVNTYKNITAEQIMQLANTYYQEEDFYDLIVY